MDAAAGGEDVEVAGPLVGRTCRRRWSHPDLEEEGGRGTDAELGDAVREEGVVVEGLQDRCFDDVFVLTEFVSSSAIAFSDKAGEEGWELDANSLRSCESSGGDDGLPISDRFHCSSSGVKTMGLPVHVLACGGETKSSARGFPGGRDWVVSLVGLVMRSLTAGSMLGSGS